MRFGNPRYLAFEETPITLAESSTGEVMMKIAGKQQTRDIINRLTLDELIRMIDLNSCNIEFFDAIAINIPAAFTDKEMLNYKNFDKPYARIDDL